MTFTLKREIPTGQKLAILLHFRFHGVYISSSDLGFCVLQHNFAPQIMLYQGILQNQKSSPHPLVAAIGFGTGIGTMRCKEFPVHDYVGTWCTQYGGPPFSSFRSARRLSLDADGAMVVFGHGSSILAMEHRATIAPGASGTAGCLLTNESIFYCQVVSRKGFVIKYVTIL